MINRSVDIGYVLSNFAGLEETCVAVSALHRQQRNLHWFIDTARVQPDRLLKRPDNGEYAVFDTRHTDRPKGLPNERQARISNGLA
jgi:hypothetical protein